MLAIGIIQESNSAWSSPTVLVKKEDGTTQFCIGYRRLNQVTKVGAYPLPHIEDSLNTLGGARFFCSLDLASRYWQVEMYAADREKTAFITQGGLYEFRVMPFGLVNAPATFERNCLVRVFGISRRHPGFRSRLSSVGDDRTKAEGQEVSVIPGGDSLTGPHCICCGDRCRPGQMPTGTGLAGPQRPTQGKVVRRTMFIIQKTYSGLYGASCPPV